MHQVGTQTSKGSDGLISPKLSETRVESPLRGEYHSFKGIGLFSLAVIGSDAALSKVVANVDSRLKGIPGQIQNTLKPFPNSLDPVK